MPLKLKHSGDAGDAVYSLPCLQEFAKQFGPVELYLNPGQRAHPFGGQHFTAERVRWLKPLLDTQPYVGAVRTWGGEPVDVDLDRFRHLPIDFTRGNIAGWYRWAFAVSPDLSRPWLSVPPCKPGGILVNRSARYHNPLISYRFMTGKGVEFVGLPDEFEAFKKEVPDAAYRPCRSALQMAWRIGACRFFVANQSLPFSIAEGLKVNRLLEVCLKCPNVIPSGGKSFDTVNQYGFEWSFQKLEEET